MFFQIHKLFHTQAAATSISCGSCYKVKLEPASTPTDELMLATTFCFHCPPQSCLHFEGKAEAVGVRLSFNSCPPVKACALATHAAACNRAVLNEPHTPSVIPPYTPKANKQNSLEYCASGQPSCSEFSRTVKLNRTQTLATLRMQMIHIALLLLEIHSSRTASGTEHFARLFL